MPRENARFHGQKAEEYAETEHGIACLNGHIDGERYSNGTSVEVKGCQLQYANGEHGRIRIWKTQFECLKDKDGDVLVVVYDPTAREPVQHSRFVHWSTIAEYANWYTAGSHPMGPEQTQITWTRFFPDLG